MIKQKKLLLRCSDNSVIVMAFVLDDGFTVRRQGIDAEIDDEIRRASAGFPQDRLPIVSWTEITETDLPERTYRNAWTTKGNKIEHDMVKARDLHREKLRIERFHQLEVLDIDYMKALETTNTSEQAAIIQKKNKLRDVTVDLRIDAAKNIEELKALTLDLLIKG